MNPYREAFYLRQAEWHGYTDPEFARQKHEQRSQYYQWYTREWLPSATDTRILDIGCGSGQFLYFLRKAGYAHAQGVDLDSTQVEVARSLGLDCRAVPVIDYLREDMPPFGLIAMLDILEHFTREELYPIMEAVVARLAPGGKVIVSVPNAESPDGLRAVYADITHELAFSPTSLAELFFCHGLRVQAFRDPWPAPVSPARECYRAVTIVARSLESFRLRLLGFDPPKYWSSVIWAIAQKPLDAGAQSPDGRGT
ncbi:MAG TPA: class I SAM-dependent methyltransferase [Isosphaeraceae bacterium]|jgi:2-polyprenyl-3-methyl-5-hydroxy-6-metoxy-1,4-benzoquinol methylase|nr:class I SAM-dependent methyltransferase [Isosphaeraceae bacterium]